MLQTLNLPSLGFLSVTLACTNHPLHAGYTAIDYAFLRRMSMSARVPNSFELIVRGFLQNAVFAGPFEVKLSRYMPLQVAHAHCVHT